MSNNLLPDANAASFENGSTAFWTAGGTFGTSTYTGSTTVAFDGVYSMAMSESTGGELFGCSTAKSAVGVVVGLPYTLSAYFQAAATPRSPVVTWDWYDAALVFVSGGGNTGGAPDAVGSWSRVEATATAPANAAYAQLSVYFGNSTAGETHYADGMQWEQASSASTFVLPSWPPLRVVASNQRW